jgi:hypothetical protein
MIKFEEIEALYNKATAGKAVPSVAFLPLGTLRKIALRQGATDIRDDVRAFVENTAIPDEVSVQLTDKFIRVMGG